MTLQRIDQMAAELHSRAPVDAIELANLIALARVGLVQERGDKANHPLHLLIAKIPDFDLGWTSDQKLSWFEGMAKLLQAAS